MFFIYEVVNSQKIWKGLSSQKKSTCKVWFTRRSDRNICSLWCFSADIVCDVIASPHSWSADQNIERTKQLIVMSHWPRPLWPLDQSALYTISRAVRETVGAGVRQIMLSTTLCVTLKDGKNVFKYAAFCVLWVESHAQLYYVLHCCWDQELQMQNKSLWKYRLLEKHILSQDDMIRWCYDAVIKELLSDRSSDFFYYRISSWPLAALCMEHINCAAHVVIGSELCLCHQRVTWALCVCKYCLTLPIFTFLSWRRREIDCHVSKSTNQKHALNIDMSAASYRSW